MATNGQIDQIIENEKKDFVEKVNTGFQFPKKDFNTKDMDMIQKMNLIAQAVVVP